MLNAFVLEGYVSSELSADVTADGHPKVSFQVACLRDPFGKRRRIVADYIRLYAYGKMTTVLRNANLSRGTHITAHTRIKTVRLYRNGRAYYHMEPVIERIYFNRNVSDAPDVDFDAEERDNPFPESEEPDEEV